MIVKIIKDFIDSQKQIALGPIYPCKKCGEPIYFCDCEKDKRGGKIKEEGEK